jgi:hypothetical protein
MARFELIGDNTYVNVDYISHIVQDKFGVATVTMQDGSAFKIKNKGNCSEPLLTAGRSQRSQQKQLSKLHKR